MIVVLNKKNKILENIQQVYFEVFSKKVLWRNLYMRLIAVTAAICSTTYFLSLWTKQPVICLGNIIM